MNSRLQRSQDRKSLVLEEDMRPRASVFERLGSRHMSPNSSVQSSSLQHNNRHYQNHFPNNNSNNNYNQHSPHQNIQIPSNAHTSFQTQGGHTSSQNHGQRRLLMSPSHDTSFVSRSDCNSIERRLAKPHASNSPRTHNDHDTMNNMNNVRNRSNISGNFQQSRSSHHSPIPTDTHVSRPSKNHSHLTEKKSRVSTSNQHTYHCRNGSIPESSARISHDSQSKMRNFDMNDEEDLEKRRLQIRQELESLRTAKTHENSGGKNCEMVPMRRNRPKYQSPCSHSSRSRCSSRSSQSCSYSSSGSCSRTNSSCSSQRYSSSNVNVVAARSSRLYHKNSKERIHKHTKPCPTNERKDYPMVASTSKHNNSFTPDYVNERSDTSMSNSKYRQVIKPTASPVHTNRSSSAMMDRSRTPQSNSSSYYSRKSRPLSPSGTSHRSTHSQSPLTAHGMINKNDSLKYDRHGNIRISLRDKERQRRVQSALNDSPIISNSSNVSNRLSTGSPTFRSQTRSPSRRLEEVFVSEDRNQGHYSTSFEGINSNNSSHYAQTNAPIRRVPPPPPPHLEEFNRELNLKRKNEENRMRIMNMNQQHQRNEFKKAKLQPAGNADYHPVKSETISTPIVKTNNYNFESNHNKPQQIKPPLSIFDKTSSEMSPISNSSLFGDEESIKQEANGEPEPGEIVDSTDDLKAEAQVSVDCKLTLDQTSNDKDKNASNTQTDDQQHFSDWSDADDYDLLNRKDFLDEIKQRSDQQLEAISDDEFDAHMEETSVDGSKDQLSPKQVLDILDIDWKSLVERNETLQFMPGSARKRFSPANLFAQIGISERLAGTHLTEKIGQVCSQSECFQGFRHKNAFLHMALQSRVSQNQYRNHISDLAACSDLQYKRFLSYGTCVRMPFQQLLQKLSLNCNTKDSAVECE